MLGWWLPRAGTLLIVRQPLDAPDAIISLASHEWERLPETIALAQRNPRSLVLLTEPQPVTEFNCHDCAHRVELLTRNGISRDRITVLPIVVGSGTYGEALTCRRFADTAGVRRLIIVTSPYHTRRALAAFRSAFAGTGVQLGSVPARQSPARPDRWWATPYDRWYVRYEWAASLYYAFRYAVWSWRAGAP